MSNAADKIINRLVEHNKEVQERGALYLTLESQNFLLKEIKWKLGLGWSPEDIFAFLKNSEEVNSLLDEDIALAAMDRISAKYAVALS